MTLTKNQKIIFGIAAVLGGIYILDRFSRKVGVKIGAVDPEDISLHQIDNDGYGNPRYVVHFTQLADTYEKAVKLGNKIGGRKYHNKRYGGGIVFQSYNTDDLKKKIAKISEN